MTDLEPDVSTRAGVSPMWIIPIVALVAGVWMVVQSYLSEGPTIRIHFQTAAGLEEGKTKVKMLAVDVGLVEEVVLNDDISGVTATVTLDKAVTPLLRDDTKFWVVRARVGAGGVSGFSTILSGAYIELAPGTGNAGEREFVGLETPPLTPVGAPGKHLTLTSDRASISAGDPVLYQGFRVGRVEAMQFDTDSNQAEYKIFVDAPYDELVRTTTRFWDTSGIAVDISAEGLQLQVGSAETILVGGVAFGSPPDLPPGEVVSADSAFRLYPSYSAILENPYQHGRHYVVAFSQPLGGLFPGAPVTFRGIRIGSVDRILLKELNRADGIEGEGSAIPVLIYIEPGRMELPDAAPSVDALHQTIENGVTNGLRATLKTGNLLTGKQEVDFDFHPNAPEAEIGQFDRYDLLPTIPSGVGRLAEQVGDLLDKLNKLPIEETVANANGTLARAETLVANLNEGVTSLNAILADGSTKALPGELVNTLDELRSVLDGFSQDAELYQDVNASLTSLDRALDSINRLARQLAERPNSVLFSPPPQEDPVPEARP
jgi:paraquat-inducible protein B